MEKADEYVYLDAVLGLHGRAVAFCVKLSYLEQADDAALLYMMRRLVASVQRIRAQGDTIRIPQGVEEGDSGTIEIPD